jgi:spore coat polysaccharide biosynthesis predicted glycosyltransferase SpsG
MGHVARSRALAQSFRAAGWQTIFACKDDPAVRAFLKGEIVETPDAIEKLKADVVIADLSHRHSAQQPEAAAEYFDVLKQATKCLVLLEGNGQECVSARVKNHADIVVLPYVGAVPTVLGAARVLSGASYAILSDSFAKAAAQLRFVRPQVEKVLITMGGTDPFGLTFCAVKATAEASLDAQIRVVIGPGFSSGAIAEIEGATAGDARFVLVREADLAEELLDCDLALISDGLTKYEAAATGAPAIVMCFDAHQKALSADFATTGTCQYFGPQVSEDLHPLIQLIKTLSGDFDHRRKMSEAGKRLLDGKGGERIVSEVTKELVCYGKTN